MKKIIQKPQYFFMFLAVLILISGFINKEEALLISFQNVYIDVDVWATSIFSSVFFVLISVNYFSLTITQRFPKKGLTIAHIILQVISLIPFLYYFYTADLDRIPDEIDFMNAILFFAFIIFLLASLLHVINFLASLLMKKE